MSLKNNILGDIPKKDKLKTKWIQTNEPIELILTDSSKPNFNTYNKQEKIIFDKLKIIADKEIILKPTQITEIKNNVDSTFNIDWNKIIGYDDIKIVINNVLSTNSKKKTHLLIGGKAGTSKTIFLKVIEANLKQFGKNVHYLDVSTLSSSGVIEYLFKNDVQYLLLDEIDKLERIHQSVFLNLLESGILQETKHNRIRKKEFHDLIALATANYLDKLLEPLLTRFLVLEIPEYTKEQFFKISIELLVSQYGKTKEIAEYITTKIWNIWTTKRHKNPNMRQCVQVANISGNDKKQIDIIINTLDKFSKSYD